MKLFRKVDIIILLIILCILGFWAKKAYLKYYNKDKIQAPIEESKPIEVESQTSLNDRYIDRLNIDNKKYKLEARITNPTPNALIVNPIKVKGSALNYWFFEGTAQLTIVDSTGKTVGYGSANALTDWMADGQIEFESTINFNTTDTIGKIILSNDNPSGFPERSKAIEIPIRFK